MIVDDVQGVGDTWRRHGDSLRLLTPERTTACPGLPFPDGSWQLPGKDEVAVYLETYALGHDLPVRLRTRVDRLTGQADQVRRRGLGAAGVGREAAYVARYITDRTTARAAMNA